MYLLTVDVSMSHSYGQFEPREIMVTYLMASWCPSRRKIYTWKLKISCLKSKIIWTQPAIAIFFWGGHQNCYKIQGCTLYVFLRIRIFWPHFIHWAFWGGKHVNLLENKPVFLVFFKLKNWQFFSIAPPGISSGDNLVLHGCFPKQFFWTPEQSQTHHW